MRRGYFLFTPELLCQILQLPDGVYPYGADWDFPRDAMRLYIASDELPDLSEGANPPQYSYSMDKNGTAQIDGNGSDPYVEWATETDVAH